jgi:PAS domain S-box-containing protein
MKPGADLSFLAGGGEMFERTRTMDWSSTALGPAGGWPQSLKTAVSICLGSRHPIVVWWGNPAYTQFYNDAYISFLGGTKHPRWLGQSGRECWSEIWPIIGPMLESVYASGQATWSEDLLLVLHRNLPREEGYFTFSYSPIRDDDGAIGGVFCACNETTGRVIGERRLRTLRDLSRMEAEAKTAERACEVAARTLGENPGDIPFALIYLLDADAGNARLVATTALEAGGAGAPTRIQLKGASDASSTWPLRRVLDTGTAQLVSNVSTKFGSLPGGPWPESPEAALVVPISEPGQTGPTGFLVSGLSPRRVIDADYGSFLELVAGHVGTSMANARAYEEERKRAEALADIDRAKTAFFSNVSHEFRTPLALMMGPLEDALTQSDGLPAADRERLELAHRNCLRLLKLVNTLLDFSRIEAGRIQASYEPTDLAVLTTELASGFRSAVERAGMKLVIDCPSLSEPVYVDREMWEKIVLNLISNAFKFTFEGEIAVALRYEGSTVQMTVRDTGTGIPADEIPHLFERFHRVKCARGRSYEGSGIGLALVQELVKLHRGGVRIESELDRGSRFIVSIPLGKAHLPADRIDAARTLASTGLRTEAYIEEALRWLPDEPHAPRRPPAETLDQAAEELGADRSISLPPHARQTVQRILVVDDNADMREYVRRILSGYEVEAVADGLAALRVARQRTPDLVLTDVMMPGLDGVGLLRELRADAQLGGVPVILLSARAGEEARIEGMHAGADDYLIKPFSARELLARVESHVKMAHYRHEATEALRHRTAQFETLLNQAPLGVYLIDADFRVREVNPTALRVFGDIPGVVIGRDFSEIMHVLWEEKYADELVEIFRHTLETGEPYIAAERAEFRADRGVTEYYELRLDRIVLPDGRFGVVCYFRDISRQVQAESTRQLLVSELNHRVKNTLASVQAIVQQTLRSTQDPADFATRFSGRIQSLARVHSLLTDATWQGTDLRELIRDQLLQGPVDETRLTACGPAVRLKPQTAVHLALMLHELGTNSTKHGALSAIGGRVAVSWSVTNDVLNLQWVERGGPAVASPTRRGFGTTLIEQSAKSEGGSTRMLCKPEGITWEIALALPHSTIPDASFGLLESELMGPMTEQQGKPAPAKRRAILAGRRFLVVEDEALVALDLAYSLEHAGAEVAPPVGTEKEALEIIENGDFDGALLDANLHGRSVNEIAAALTRRNIPFVFITGYGPQGLRTSFEHATILAKPVSDQQLLEAVVRLVPTGSTTAQPSS